MAIDLRRTGLVTALVLSAATLAAQTPQQPPPPEVTTGLILGRAVDAGTGKPVSSAFVTLTTPSAPPGFSPPGTPTAISRFPMRVVADSSGRFVFHDLPKGVFTLSASKSGYNPTAFGRSNATDLNSQPLILAEGERRGDVTLKLWKYASLSGRVVDEAGEPIIGITLKVLRRVNAGGRALFTQSGNTPITDDRGIYRIATLVPGDYIVVLVNTQTTVPVSLQEQMASATGAQDLQRQLERSSSLLSIFGAGGSSGQRVGSMMLSPGDRSMAAPPLRGGRLFVYPTTYYPTATTASKATVLTLGSGDDRTAIDFHLRPVATSAISGTLVGQNGPEPFTVLTLTTAGDNGLQRDFDVSTAESTTDAAGAFTFLGITPGAYVIRTLKMPPRPVSTSPSFGTVIQTGTSTIFSSGGGSTTPAIPDGPTLWAATPVNVADTDVTGVTVPLSAGARVSGHLEFDGGTEKPAAERLVQIAVQIDSADNRSSTLNSYNLGRGVVDATGQFHTYQLPPGRYVIRAPSSPQGWSFKSATLSGRDVSDSPVDIGRDDINNIVVTFTDRPTELSGTARDSKGPDATATVLVFPAQPALWLDHGPQPRRFKAIRAGSDGAYTVANIPPGDYLLVAVRTGVPSDWPNPALLQKLTALATRVTVADGEKKSIDVETKEVK